VSTAAEYGILAAPMLGLRPGRRGARLAAAAIAVAAVIGDSATGAAPGAVILRKAGGSAPLAAALSRQLPDARVLELSGDAPADSALLARETRGAPVLFAIGPDATEAAGEARGTAVVSLGVANPAQVRTPGTYVSVYPALEAVFAYLKTSLHATRAGLVFTPAKNREVALQFLKAGSAQGVTVVPITVGSPADLARELGPALSRVDVLLLAVDPILFDPRNLELIVNEARSARKPTLGFLEDLTRLGITLALLATPDAAAAAALSASGAPVLVGKRRVDADGTIVVVSRAAATAIGLNPEALAAQRVE
jgi:hypothetical protein